jgi:phospholipid/cholesterol/gamma-HCH transport system substrate-binding protein
LSSLTRDAPGPVAPPPGRDAPGAGRRASRSPRRRSPWRLPALAAVLLVAGIVVYLVTRSDDYHYRFDFIDAGQLVNGDLVRIGGTPAGKVEAIRLTHNGQAEIEVSIDSSFGPLRQGTTAAIRQQSLVGVASRYISVSPAPTFHPAMPDDGVVPASHTSGIVDVDEIFNALDANTLQGLRRVIRGFAVWYAGKSSQANESARYFPPALQAYSRLFDQLDASSPELTQLLQQTSAALGAINQRSSQLTDVITQARITSQALGSDNQALSQALENLPSALNKGTATFARLRQSTLPALSHLFSVTRPVIAPLAPFLKRLQPVLDEATPTFGRLSQVFNQPGPNNDLYDALVDLPPLAKQVNGDFPRAIKALNQSTPIFEFARPYIPDLVGWVTNWDGLFAPYDANGHYARTVPVFDAFSFSDDAQGGTLIPKPTNLRGSGGDLRTGFLQRCPGGAIAPPLDASAPFVDSEPLSNAHCRPSETIGGTP